MTWAVQATTPDCLSFTVVASTCYAKGKEAHASVTAYGGALGSGEPDTRTPEVPSERGQSSTMGHLSPAGASQDLEVDSRTRLSV